MVGVRITLDNVIKFPVTNRLYKLSFIVPSKSKISKTPTDEISLDLHTTESGQLYGVALVFAKNKTEAKDKLTKVIQVSEWVENT